MMKGLKQELPHAHVKAVDWVTRDLDAACRALVDELGIDVFAFGILTDFRTKLFPGSQRLVELAEARTYPARHGAILLPWRAAAAAAQARFAASGRAAARSAQRHCR